MTRGAEPGGQEARGHQRCLAVAALVVAAAALVFTWYRLAYGLDLNDESFSVVIPWRWALGDRPFIDEMNLAQLASLLTYPFVKAYAVVAGGSATGLILFTRYLYLAFVAAVAAGCFAFLRTVVRWELALPAAAVAVTVAFQGVTNLTVNTMAAGLLTVGFFVAAWVVVHGRGRRFALAAGICHGLACVAYPTLLFTVPFVAVFLAVAHGRQALAMVVAVTPHVPPDPEPDAAPTGPRAAGAVIAYAAGAVMPVAAAGLFALGSGVGNLIRCWNFTLRNARDMNELSGTGKAVDVCVGAVRFIASQWAPILVVAAAYLIYRRWPRLGRALLLTLPVVLFLAAQRPGSETAGFVLMYALLAPCLYLFVPADRRDAGARLLVWIWPSALVTGAMTAYTSSNGFVQAAVGFFPAAILSGLFLAWVLLSAVRGRVAAVWLAYAALAGVLAVTIVLQFQYQVCGASYESLTATPRSGPWQGVHMTPRQAAYLRGVERDLALAGRSGDALLVYFHQPGLYLLWPYDIATASVALQGRPPGDDAAPLPSAAIAYWHRVQRVPDLVLRAGEADGESAAAIDENAFGYPAAVTRAAYTIRRRPSGDSTRVVLGRLPRRQ